MSERELRPTKLNLIKVRRRLAVAVKILRLLRNKREVLLSTIFREIKRAEALSAEVGPAWAAVLAGYRRVSSLMGVRGTDALALSVTRSPEVRVARRLVFGIPYYEVKVVCDPRTFYGPATTPSGLDRFLRDFSEALTKLARLASLEAAIYRLAFELRRTQRTINALEHYIIPRYRQAVKYISTYLEEREREELVKIKMVRDVLHARG